MRLPKVAALVLIVSSARVTKMSALPLGADVALLNRHVHLRRFMGGLGRVPEI
jgi:hypothetical protein